jgi:hypothetical protein
MASKNLPVLYVKKSEKLPDNAQWTNRFYVRSASTSNLYTVAQNKSGRWWACSCRGWIAHKRCKHLRAMALPEGYKPYEAVLA